MDPRFRGLPRVSHILVVGTAAGAAGIELRELGDAVADDPLVAQRQKCVGLRLVVDGTTHVDRNRQRCRGS
jgi:hypothetical protein